jgi:hypothetical protein
LERMPVSQAIHTSEWIIPTVQTLHIVFAGRWIAYVRVR